MRECCAGCPVCHDSQFRSLCVPGDEAPVPEKEGIKPTFTERPVITQSEDGNRITLECRCVGDPRPEVQWYVSHLYSAASIIQTLIILTSGVANETKFKLARHALDPPNLMCTRLPLTMEFKYQIVFLNVSDHLKWIYFSSRVWSWKRNSDECHYNMWNGIMETAENYYLPPNSHMVYVGTKPSINNKWPFDL